MVTNVIFSISLSTMQIWLYLENPSIKENKEFLAYYLPECRYEAKENYPLDFPDLNPNNQHTFVLNFL